MKWFFFRWFHRHQNILLTSSWLHLSSGNLFLCACHSLELYSQLQGVVLAGRKLCLCIYSPRIRTVCPHVNSDTVLRIKRSFPSLQGDARQVLSALGLVMWVSRSTSTGQPVSPSPHALASFSRTVAMTGLPSLVKLQDGWKFWRSTLKSSNSVQTKCLGGKSRRVCGNADASLPRGFLQRGESFLTSA